jgi:hypothetical protein
LNALKGARVPRTKSASQLDREIAEILGGGTSHAARLGHRWKDREHRGRRSRGRWRGTEVQSLLFARPRWTEGKAKSWAKDHDYKSGQVDITDNYVRLRQFDPIAGTQKRTITFGDGIKAIIEQVK